MALTIGTRLGVYEVTAQIAVDGMGEVYRARDTKLDCDVAIKILPELFAADPERLARFDRAGHRSAVGRPHSRTPVMRDWTLARAWLFRELSDEAPDDV